MNTGISSFLSRTRSVGIVLGVVGVEQSFRRFQILEEVSIIGIILLRPFTRYAGIEKGSPCIEWRLVILVIVITKLLVGVEKAML